MVYIILGLALRNSLRDLFSGIALTLGRPDVIGDWIALRDGIECCVFESTWRSAEAGVNNGRSAKQCAGTTRIDQVSLPDATHVLTMGGRTALTRMPAAVIEVLQTVLLSCSSILQEPPPIVALKGPDVTAPNIERESRVESPAGRLQARSEVLDLVRHHRKPAGLMLTVRAEGGRVMAKLTGPTARLARFTCDRETDVT